MKTRMPALYASFSLPMPATGSRNFTSTACASTPPRTSTTPRRTIFWRPSPAGCGTRPVDVPLLLVAENEPQHTQLVRPPEQGGYGLDMLWNDDFHHSAMVALTGRSAAYYTDYRGTPQEFISALKWGYLYQGQYYTWQQQRRGTPAFDLTAGSVCDLSAEPRPDCQLRPRAALSRS